MLKVLSDKCRLRLSSCDPDRYICRTEVPIRDGRIDLALTPRPGAPGCSFWLENKVGAPLTAPQLRRYHLQREGRRLVALTKYAPEVGAKWLAENKCAALRWQEVHRALAGSRARKGADRFICESFLEYLEELDMAHREDVGLNELTYQARFFKSVSARARYAQMNASRAFIAGAATLEILREVLDQVLETEPRLRSWTRWGPSYFVWKENGETYHHLAFQFRRHGWKRQVGAGFVFYNGEVRWLLHAIYVQHDIDIHEEKHPRRVLNRDGVIDSAKAVQSFRRFISKVGVVGRGRSRSR